MARLGEQGNGLALKVAGRKLADLCGSELNVRKLVDLCGVELNAAQRGNLLTLVDRSSTQHGSKIC